jgi:regulator of protease activity HflC (stomatin/prohibitin superfamily)
MPRQLNIKLTPELLADNPALYRQIYESKERRRKARRRRRSKTERGKQLAKAQGARYRATHREEERQRQAKIRAQKKLEKEMYNSLVTSDSTGVIQ